jgi:hypothetical protein
MDAFVKRAHEAGSCLLVVTRSSNPEGRTVQASVDGSGRSVETVLLEEIGALNAALAPGEVGPIGAVVGPTHKTPILDLRAAQTLFSAPGVGAQGATGWMWQKSLPPALIESCQVHRDQCFSLVLTFRNCVIGWNGLLPNSACSFAPKNSGRQPAVPGQVGLNGGNRSTLRSHR